MDSNVYQFPILNIFKMKSMKSGLLDSSNSGSATEQPERIPRSLSVSHSFYTESGPHEPAATPQQLASKRYTTTQSQRLHPWIVFVISYTLGVHPNRTRALGTIVHVITFSVALVYIVTFFWVRTYDVMSPNTPLDILQGTITILIALIWASLGMYAKSLIKRMFRHPRFVKDIRMHSRTIFKINAAFLAFLLGLIFIVTNDIDSTGFTDPQTCERIELPVFVCWMYFVSKVIFSIFSLIWNTLVAIFLISICRTHTIGLRRFIKELEADALLCDNINCKQHRECPMTKEDVCEETFWLEEEQSSEEDFIFLGQQAPPQDQKKTSDSGIFVTRDEVPKQSITFQVTEEQDSDSEGISSIPVKLVINEPELSSNGINYDDGCLDEGNFNGNHEEFTNQQVIPSCSAYKEVELHTFPEASEESTIEESQEVPKRKYMPSEEILHKYWKISCRLRASSCVFQRWLASLMALIIIWCIIYLLHWQYQPANIRDVIQFVIPLMLLPLLCSAFAEVNLEGVRMPKVIFPLDDRLGLLRFLQTNPLQMTVFNVNMSYSTILTVVFAIFVAFTSRLIFTELQKN